MILGTPSTAMGGLETEFPKTRWSVILGASQADTPASRQSMEDLAGLYWRPVYCYFRRKWRRSSEEAKDCTQEFFAAMAAQGFLERLRPENGRFRSYVMAALDNVARGEHRRKGARKRGGGAPLFSIEADPGFEPEDKGSPEDAFLREWAESILRDALRVMEEEYRLGGRETEFGLFSFRDLESGPDRDRSYEELSRRFGLRVTQVTHVLYLARKRLRELVLRRVRDSVTTQEEAEQEMIDLFAGPSR
jgi:RNA polymerase sigma factor (sigma-70 family)